MVKYCVCSSCKKKSILRCVRCDTVLDCKCGCEVEKPHILLSGSGYRVAICFECLYEID